MPYNYLRIIVILGLLYTSFSSAQSVYVPVNSDYYWQIDRLDIKGGTSGNIFTTSKPYLRKDIAALADSISKDTSKRFSKVDKRNIEYLRDDNWEFSNIPDSGNSKKKFIWNLYHKRNDFYEINTKNFECQINPVIYFSAGKSKEDSMKTIYQNTRGFEVRGMIDNKVGFYTLLTDNQATFPQYVNRRIASTSVVPGEGYWVPYRTTGYDFYDVNGYITFNVTKHIGIQFGQDKNFIGDGYRSLLLSDYSPSYLFLKIDTKVWKFDYVNIFAQMTANILTDGAVPIGDVSYPRKYMALHYLSYNVCKKLNVGVFECITFGNTDSVHNRGFDPSYLNPIIFYKAVENGLGAPDKDHIGLTVKWNLLHHFSLYGAVLIDEFNIDEIRQYPGWWGEKWGVQAGVKWVDIFGIHNLDGQYEFNAVRPYTYTHFSFSNSTDYSYYANYSNYDQPLADPNGANFYENILIAHFQPFYKFSFTGKIIYTATGLDTAGSTDNGSNIMKGAYNSKIPYSGNSITQGYFTTVFYINFTASYQVTHNMFIDLVATMRKETSQLKSQTVTDDVLSIAFRWNIGQRLQEF